MSKDEDFHRRAVLRGASPKFVWIQLGNCTTDDIAQLFEMLIPKDEWERKVFTEFTDAAGLSVDPGSLAEAGFGASQVIALLVHQLPAPPSK